MRDRVAARIAWLAVCVALVLLRFPFLAGGSRPYAEEGIVYLTDAAAHGVGPSLFARHLGYLSLVANSAGAVEASVPPAAIPWASVAFGVVGPFVCCWMVVRMPAPTPARLVGVGLVVFTNTMAREWYSPIHAQFWLATAVILLIAAGATRWQAAADVAVAGLAGLSGAVAMLALPVLAVAAWRQRSRRLVAVAVALAATSAVQLAVGTSRASTMPLGRFPLVVLVKLMWFPLTGESGEHLAERAWQQTGPGWAMLWVLALLAVLGMITVATNGVWRYLAAGGLLVGAASLWFSLPPADAMMAADYGGRYALAGVVPIAIAVLMSQWSHAARAGDPLRRVGAWGSAVLVGLLIAVGHHASAPLPTASARSWADEVDRYRRDPGTTLELEYPDCRVSLNPSAQRRDFTVETRPTASAVAVTVRPGEFDRHRELGVYVFRLDPGPSFLSAGRWARADGFFMGGDAGGSVIGRCHVGTPPEPLTAVTTTDRAPSIAVSIPRRLVPATSGPVFIGYGRSFGDMLAKDTYAPLAPR